jgi:hypothetical protein
MLSMLSGNFDCSIAFSKSLSASLTSVSRCTVIEDCRLNVFNTYPRFHYNVIALKSRIGVLKLRTERELKFVSDLNTKVAITQL